MIEKSIKEELDKLLHFKFMHGFYIGIICGIIGTFLSVFAHGCF